MSISESKVVLRRFWFLIAEIDPRRIVFVGRESRGVWNRCPSSPFIQRWSLIEGLLSLWVRLVLSQSASLFRGSARECRKNRSMYRNCLVDCEKWESNWITFQKQKKLTFSFPYFVISENCSVAPLIFSLYRNCFVDCDKWESNWATFRKQMKLMSSFFFWSQKVAQLLPWFFECTGICFVDCDKWQSNWATFWKQMKLMSSIFVISESCSVAPLIFSMYRKCFVDCENWESNWATFRKHMKLMFSFLFFWSQKVAQLLPWFFQCTGIVL